MATTASQITDQAAWSPFYVLRIGGLPYDFVATINPYDTAYGGDAWTIGTGKTAVRGMQLPDEALTQELPDLAGCTATPERLRLRLVDVKQTDTNGTYNLLSRIWAMGRALADTTVDLGYLSADLSATETTSFTARSGDTFDSSGTVYVGSEAIGYTSTTVSSSVTTFTTLTRNKFPAHSDWPGTPYYRVRKDSAGNVIPSDQTPVTSIPLTLIGRPAALYVGHMRPSGVPETEANALTRFVGRVIGFEYDGGLFVVELESVLGVLDTARVAPGLARAEIRHQIVLTDPKWRSFILGFQVGQRSDGDVRVTEATVSIDNGGTNVFSSLTDVMRSINAALKTLGATVELAPDYIPGVGDRLVFRYISALDPGAAFNYRPFVRHGVTVSEAKPAGRGNGSLLSVLGYPPEPTDFIADDPSTFGLSSSTGNLMLIVPPNPPCSVFIPTSTMSANVFSVHGDDDPGARFFTNQGDGSGRAWARFDDGQVVELSAASSGSLTTRQSLEVMYRKLVSRDPAFRYAPTYYSQPAGSSGFIDQVVVAPDPFAFPQPGIVRVMGQLLASTRHVASDGEFNVLPQGVGLGLNGILSKASFRREEPFQVNRRVVIDARTTFTELWEPVAKEYGLFLVWSPEDEAIMLRSIELPSAANASTFDFDESNRTDPNERTTARWDPRHVVGGWTIEWGYDGSQDKFTGPPVTISDNWARNAYGAETKHITLKDKTLAVGVGSSPSRILSALARRSIYFRHPWVQLTRRVNKRGLVLSPGTYHQIIDATIPNPFDGTHGIDSGDNVYGLLMGVSANLATAEVEATLLLNTFPKGAIRPWAPTARVDRSSGTNGYTAGSKTLYFTRHYTGNATAANKDGIDFAAGDVVVVATRDNDGAPTTHSDTIVSVAADGASVVLTTGLSAGLQTALVTTEAIMYLAKYTSSTASRQSGAGAVSWKGDATDGKIQATARNTVWS